MTDPRLDAVRKFWEAGFNERNADAIRESIAEDYVNHAALPGTPPGPDGQVLLMRRLCGAFPDGRFEIEHLATDGDTVICVGTMTGTHEGELMGVRGSGKKVSWPQCHMIKINDEGQAVEHRAVRDDLGLLRQIGALPGG